MRRAFTQLQAFVWQFLLLILLHNSFAAIAASISSILAAPLLFKPSVQLSHVDHVPPPFPSHTVYATLDPYPLHVALQPTEKSTFHFNVKPYIPTCGARLHDMGNDAIPSSSSTSINATSTSHGATLVSFDWVRNKTVAVITDRSSLNTDHFDLSWSDSLPSWLKYTPVAPSASPPSTDSSNGFILELSTLTINGSNNSYFDPSPIVIQFIAVVQYQCPPPMVPDMAMMGQASSANSDTTASNDADSSSRASPINTHEATTIGVIEEIQSLSIVVSLAILPPFAQRQQDLASSYFLAPSPSLLDSGIRFLNHIPSKTVSSDTSRVVDFASAKFGRNDEVVFDCASAVCNLCTPAGLTSVSSNSTSSFSTFCSFPSGSFVSILSGVVSAKRPLSVQGSLEIHANAVLEIDHSSASSDLDAMRNADSSLQQRYLRNEASIIHRIDLGSSGFVVNEGTIRVKRGHLVLYSPCIGRGKIEVHEGASVEFLSLLPDASAWMFNQSSVNDIAPMMSAQSPYGQTRRLLQIDTDSIAAGNDTEVVGTTSSVNSTAASTTGPIDSVFEYTSAASSAANSSGLTGSSAEVNSSVVVSASSTGNIASSSWPSNLVSNFESTLSPASCSNGEFETSGLQLSSSATEETPTNDTITSLKLNSSDSQLFYPHLQCSLISYGGSVLFSHGLFEFHSLLQSSRFAFSSNREIPESSNHNWNQLVIDSAAVVRLMPVVDRTANKSSADIVSPPEHVLSFANLYLRGVLQVGPDARANISNVLFFQINGGLLQSDQNSRTMMRISDNANVNHVAASNPLVLQRMSSEQASKLRDAMESMQQIWVEEHTSSASLSTPLDSNATDSTDASSNEAESLSPSAVEPTHTPSPAFQSVFAILHRESTDSSTLNAGLTFGSGGTAMLIEGFLSFESGKLGFSSGLIAQKQGHLFLRKGTQWTFGLRSDSNFPERSEINVIHISCIEFSLDGMLVIRRGALELYTPLLQIEGHGQLLASGSETTVLIDNMRINREMYLQSLIAQSSEAIETQLVENEDAQSSPDVGLYSIVQLNSSTSASVVPNSTSVSPSNTVAYRESLIAPCLLSNPCQSWRIGNGASLTVAPLTILHFLPHTQVFAATTISHGANFVLDPGVQYTGRRFIQNVSTSFDFSSSDSSLDFAPASQETLLSFASVHIGNDSHLSMSRKASQMDLDSGATAEPSCFIGAGNLTGNGYFSCGSHVIQLESAMISPSFQSTSPFTRSALSTQIAADSNQTTAPSLKFGSDVQMTSKTITSFEAVSVNTFSSLVVRGSVRLDGALTINVPKGQWPFLLNGSVMDNQSSTKADSNQTLASVASSNASLFNDFSNMQSAVLIRTTLGFLPAQTPQHFSQIQFGSLFDLLPSGWNIDLDYVRSNISLTDIILATTSEASENLTSIDSPSSTVDNAITSASTITETNAIEIEQLLILKAFSPDFMKSAHTSHTLNNTMSAGTETRDQHVHDMWTLLASICLCLQLILI